MAANILSTEEPHWTSDIVAEHQLQIVAQEIQVGETDAMETMEHHCQARDDNNTSNQVSNSMRKFLHGRLLPHSQN